MSEPSPVPRYDLHTHSTCSDGSLSPTQLVEKAAAAGVTHLALTDHDSIDGLAEAELAARSSGIRLIPAVEISVSWQQKSIHVVGLGVVADHQPLTDGLASLQATREARAAEMGRRLEKQGIVGVLEYARAQASGMITRTHLAQAIVAAGLAQTTKDVFTRYLTPGKPGYVPTEWAALELAVDWIRGAGGIAVLAHPQRYKLTHSWTRRLFNEFRECGGEGVEVVSGTASPGDVQSTAAHAARLGLLGSVGSDFHGPHFPWLQLGRLPDLPPGITPVWSRWDD